MTDSNHSVPPTLLHHWVVAGIVSSSSRFIPVPFVDDIVRNQCRRYVVSRTLAAHDQSIPLGVLKPFYASEGGCIMGCLGQLAMAPLKLLLFPIRKAIALVTSVRGVPLEIMRTVLLGRTLDRYLREKSLNPTPEYSAKMRSAFDESFARMDFRVVKAAVSDSLSEIKGWKAGAIKSAKSVADSSDAGRDEMETTSDVEVGARRVEAVLQRPETLSLFAEFDRRFDETMSGVA